MICWKAENVEQYIIFPCFYAWPSPSFAILFHKS
uniref:Uncharacterized protein n=1 Tax=Rhizophora mucronata TaxID=61149 RepID=A0A2P2Q3K1_RHIMU